MRLGIGSYTFAWGVGAPGYPLPSRPVTPEDLLRRAARFGVRVVQIADNLPLDGRSVDEIERLRQLADDLAIGIELGTRGLAAGRLRAYLAIARRLRAPILRVVMDSAGERPSPSEAVDAIRVVIRDFERAGIQLAIENHDRFSTRILLQILEGVGSPQVGICLDTANSFGCLEGPDAVVAALGSRVINLHVKDFCVRRLPHQLGFLIEGRPAGRGQLDIPRLVARLREMGSDPNAILEQWTPPEETLEKTIAKEDEWAAISIGYLRRIIPE